MLGARLLPLAALAALWARPVCAQDSVHTLALQRFRDSLAQVSDSAGLVVLEARMVDTAKVDRDDAYRHLRIGLVNLRLAELGSRSRFDDAGSEFQWAADLQPDWPYPWYGLGMAEAGTIDTSYKVITRIRGLFRTDPARLAQRDLHRALTLDSAFAPAAVSLVNVVERDRLNPDPDAALAALRRAASVPEARTPQLLFALGIIERSAGSADSAVAAFRAYLAAGGNQIRGRLELARTLLALRRPEGRSYYYQIAAGDDSSAAAVLRRDLAIIAGDSTLQRFDALRGGARAAFLADFWRRRDRADLRKDGTRLEEHYRRIFYAVRHFRRLPLPRRYSGFEGYHASQLEFDDRGEIYIRHGAPTEIYRLDVGSCVSWRYKRPGGDLYFHFAPKSGGEDYRLLESVLSCPNRGDYLAGISGWNKLFSRLAVIPETSASFDHYANEVRWQAEDDIQEGVTSDRYALVFARDLPLRYQLLAVGRSSQGTLVHFVWAVPAAPLPADTSAAGRITYPVRVRASILTGTGDPVSSGDIELRPSGSVSGWIGGNVTLPSTPGSRFARLAISAGDSLGVVTAGDSLHIPRGGQRGPVLSDLVLGRAGGPVWMPTPRDTVYFNPFRSFASGETLRLYYEIYGLPAGSDYQTELTIRRKGHKEDVRIRFDEISGGGVDRAARAVGLDRLKPGDYLLRVRITDSSGRAAQAESAFTVRKPEGS